MPTVIRRPGQGNFLAAAGSQVVAILVHGKGTAEGMARVLPLQIKFGHAVGVLFYGRLKALADHELPLLLKYRLSRFNGS